MSSETIRFEGADGRGLGEVSRKLLQNQSQYFSAFLGEGGTPWGDRSETVKVGEEDGATEGYLAFLKNGWVDVNLTRREDLVEFLDLLVYADRIGADHLLSHLCSFLGQDTIAHAMRLPFLHEWCKGYLLVHFESVFCNMNTMKYVIEDAIPLILEVVQSDDLEADEEKIAEVALNLYKKFGIPAVQEILESVRLCDVGLVGLDELRSEPEVGALLLDGLCTAYARHAHLARRTKFLPFDGRQRRLFTKSIRTWPATPFTFFCRRLSEVSFSATISRTASAAAVTITPSHTFSEHIPIRAKLTITGTTSSTHTFALAFCDCNVPHGWADLPIPASFLDSGGHWTLTCHIQFTTESLPHDCG